ncbi:hypothetical protein [Streptococcus himalayensis]|uniref:hypothetical protein n=1 Tax=Streptococcus himalayensis TaxID=1888195 RepID=UPI0011AB2E46|nr:hypothetical protein [Streptococcus himalayensis]
MKFSRNNWLRIVILLGLACQWFDKTVLLIVQIGIGMLAILEIIFVLEELFFQKKLQMRDLGAVSFACFYGLIWLLILAGVLKNIGFLLLAGFLTWDILLGQNRKPYINRGSAREHVMFTPTHHKDLAKITYAYSSIIGSSMVSYFIISLDRVIVVCLLLSLQCFLINQYFLSTINRLVTKCWRIVFHINIFLMHCLPLLLFSSHVHLSVIPNILGLFLYLLALITTFHLLSLLSFIILNNEDK